MSADWGTVCNRVLEALLNGVYQGLFVAGILWLGLKLLPRSNAATRYAAGFAGIIIIAALPALHLARSLWPTVHGNIPAGAPETVTMEVSAPLIADGFAAEEPEANPPLVADPKFSRREWRFEIPLAGAVSLIAIWLLVSTARLVHLAWQCLTLRHLKHRAHAADENLLARFGVLREEMRVRRRVSLGLCETLKTPIAAGFFSPQVMLPAMLGRAGAPGRLDGIFRHELAHVRRWDDWTNLIQQVIHALFFFHPGVCWLSSRLSVEREIACDDFALASISSRREYALLLAEFASRMHCREWAAAPGAWSKKGQLKERINMILNAKRNASTRLAGASAGVLTVGAALIALLVMQAGPRVALATEPPAVAQPPEPPSAEIAEVVVNVENVGNPPQAIVSSSGETIVISGPRTKPSGVIFAPAPPVAPIAASAAAPAALPHPTPMPHPVIVAHSDDAPPAPRAVNRGGNRNLEERLERLERMVEDLAGGKKQKENFNFDFKLKGDGWDPKFHEKMAKLETDLKEKFNGKEWKEMEITIKQAMEQAGRDAERSAKDVERKMKEIHANADANVKVQKHARVDVHVDHHEDQGDNAPGDQRKKALEGQKKALEKQLQAIERQIDQMEQEQERAEEARERAQEERERQRERAENERERAKERAERDRERANQQREKANQERERANQDRQKGEQDRQRAEQERNNAQQEEKQESGDAGPDAPKRRKQ